MFLLTLLIIHNSGFLYDIFMDVLDHICIPFCCVLQVRFKVFIYYHYVCVCVRVQVFMCHGVCVDVRVELSLATSLLLPGVRIFLACFLLWAD